MTTHSFSRYINRSSKYVSECSCGWRRTFSFASVQEIIERDHVAGER